MSDALDIEQLSRDIAVTMVDGIRGHTVEFSASPEMHASDYDFWQEHIAEKIRAALSPQREEVLESNKDGDGVDLPFYDAGLLGDGGGGDIGWWHDYIRAELGRAHDFYQSQVAALSTQREEVGGSSQDQGNGLSGLPQADNTGKVELVCIEDNFYPAGPTTIRVGKTYWGRPREDGYDIINDFGHPAWMLASRFIVATDRAPKGFET